MRKCIEQIRKKYVAIKFSGPDPEKNEINVKKIPDALVTIFHPSKATIIHIMLSQGYKTGTGHWYH